ncbi:hypothetical protein C0J52_07638 [Blattella germanica]|nr:hypothetical protein C0J52_07638 [Blattella germanica]
MALLLFVIHLRIDYILPLRLKVFEINPNHQPRVKIFCMVLFYFKKNCKYYPLLFMALLLFVIHLRIYYILPLSA